MSSNSSRYGLAGDLCSLLTCLCIAISIVFYQLSQAGHQLLDVLHDHQHQLSLPNDFKSAQILHETLRHALSIAEPNVQYQLWVSITLAFVSIYIFKQAFCVPGSLILNLFAGALFGFNRALPLVCLLTVCGTTLCYIMSNLFGKRIANRLFGDRIAPVRHAVQKHRSNLLIYLISLRIFPFTPNFLLNLTAPIIGIPFPYFVLSNLFGLIPYNLITTKAGGLLATLNSASNIFDWTNIIQLIALALFALAPTLLKSRFSSLASVGSDHKIVRLLDCTESKGISNVRRRTRT